MEEIWEDIKGYEGYYQISNLGMVRSLTRYVDSNTGIRLSRGTHIKPEITKKGYVRVRLTKNNKKKNYFVHRLVAEAFIEKAVHKHFVNHLNGVKIDNRAANLEWCTFSENIHHAIVTGLVPPCRACKKVIDECANKTYNSVAEAAMSLGISLKVCRRRILEGGCLRYAA